MKYMLTFFAGAAVGAIVALLYAPKSGADLRLNIRESAIAEQEKLQLEYQQASANMQNRLDKMQSDMQTILERTKGTTDELGQTRQDET